MKLPTTKRVVVRPIVIARLFIRQAQFRHRETGALLLGRVDETDLHVEDIVPGTTPGTSVSFSFTPGDFERARGLARPGQYTVGGAHGHPGYSSFLSSVDRRHQWEAQQLFPDFVSLVLDPFRPDGVQFKFFRLDGDHEVVVPHTYGRSKKWNGNAKPSSPAGTKKPSKTFELWWRVAGRWARKR